MFILTVTGHRPNKISNQLYNIESDLSKIYIQFFKNYIMDICEKHPCRTIHCRSGMALGIDTLFAVAVLSLRKYKFPVELECCIPCANHSSMWQQSSVDVYNLIVKFADQVTFVSNKPYNNHCMQDRNVYMVNQANLVLAVWDKTSGGTANCVRYAKSLGKHIDIVAPNEIA